MAQWHTTGQLELLLLQSPRGSARVDDQYTLYKGLRALQRHDGATLLDADSTTGSRSPLQALMKLVATGLAWVAGFVTETDEQFAKATITVAFHVNFWKGLHPWKRSPSAAYIFARLQPLDKSPDKEEVPAAGPAHCSADLFRCGLLVLLPRDVLEMVIGHLDAQATCRLGSTCHLLHALSKEAVPGLRLSLYPHQRAARRWMLERERPMGVLAHPTWQPFVTQTGLPLWLCAATGDATSVEPAAVRDIRGGFFCDEPGLGKTITALALVLSTLRLRSEAPPGAAVHAMPRGRDEGEWPGAFYLAPEGCQEGTPPHAESPSPNGATRRSARDVRSPGRFTAAPPEPRSRGRSRSGKAATSACSAGPSVAAAAHSLPQPDQAPPVVTPQQKVQTKVWASPVGCAVPTAARSLPCHRRKRQRLACGGRASLPGQQQQPPDQEGPHSAALAEGTPCDVQPSGCLCGSAAPGVGGPWPCMCPRRTAQKKKQPGMVANGKELGGEDRPPLRWQGCIGEGEPGSRPCIADGDRAVFLSSATLLVVPSTLIQHWETQIGQHVAENTLRTRVLDGGGGKQADSAHELATLYDLVITTFQRLSLEKGLGRSSPLLKVKWLRVILDEGHMLGAGLAMTNKLQTARSLLAERRWVMTGTPTPDKPSAHVAHLQPLLDFLGQQPYGTQRRLWEDAIQRPFEARDPGARARLITLLKHLAIRASKDDLIMLVKCHRKVVLLDFEASHAACYNQLIEVVNNNLLLGDWGDEDHRQSLLSAANSKLAREMLNNVRLSCNVAGIANLVIKEEDLKETLELLAERLKLPTVDAEYPPWLEAGHPLARVEATLRYGGDCQRCGTLARMPIVTPCAHLLCGDCCQPHRTQCPVCELPYVMQAVSDPSRLTHNPNPKWEVPLDVIEWQPSYTQKGALGLSGGQWSADWQITKSSKCLYLHWRLAQIGAAPPLAPQPCSEQAAEAAAACPPPQQWEARTKAIVYTSFWQHQLLVEMYLATHGVALAVLRESMKAPEKSAALHAFQTSRQVGVLLMDKAGSVGLDLSFVPHLFLMEPFLDGALEEQVVARAHRMGARETVQVETLVMKGTMEEELVSLRASAKQALSRAAGAHTLASSSSPGSSAQPASSPAGRPDQGAGREALGLRNHMFRSLHPVSISKLTGQPSPSLKH